MTWHVYAAVAAGTPLGVRGVEGAAVHLVEAGAVALAASEHPLPPVATPASMMAHAQVGLRLGGVPFRFGAAAGSPEELRAQMAPRAEELANKLEAVGDCVEMVVRMPEAAEDRTSGTAYLRAKKRAADQADAVRTRLAPAVREFKEQGGRLLCLVPREQLSQFRMLARDEDVSGPWPPSSFV